MGFPCIPTFVLVIPSNPNPIFHAVNRQIPVPILPLEDPRIWQLSTIWKSYWYSMKRKNPVSHVITALISYIYATFCGTKLNYLVIKMPSGFCWLLYLNFNLLLFTYVIKFPLVIKSWIKRLNCKQSKLEMGL
jgi:hypothetical protein